LLLQRPARLSLQHWLASGFRASLRELDRLYEKSAFELEG